MGVYCACMFSSSQLIVSHFLGNHVSPQVKGIRSHTYINPNTHNGESGRYVCVCVCVCTLSAYMHVNICVCLSAKTGP